VIVGGRVLTMKHTETQSTGTGKLIKSTNPNPPKERKMNKQERHARIMEGVLVRVEELSKPEVISGMVLNRIYNKVSKHRPFLDSIPDIMVEFKLVEEKKSELSSMQRKTVVAYVNQILLDRGNAIQWSEKLKKEQDEKETNSKTNNTPIS